MRLNLSSGMATMWAPKPRKPPTLTPMVTLLPGPVTTLCTAPRLVPSDDFAVSPTKSVAAAAAVFFSLAGGVGDVAWGAADGAACGGVAAGGLIGEGGGDCVWAIAGAGGTAQNKEP